MTLHKFQFLLHHTSNRQADGTSRKLDFSVTKFPPQRYATYDPRQRQNISQLLTQHDAWILLMITRISPKQLYENEFTVVEATNGYLHSQSWSTPPCSQLQFVPRYIPVSSNH